MVTSAPTPAAAVSAGSAVDAGADQGSPLGVEPDGPTRARVARSLLEHGPSTAAQLAERLHLTAAAVRRHLDQLVEQGAIEARPPRSHGPRGRGRPAREYVLTPAGREVFDQAYDDLAASALRFLADSLGEEAVADFARARFADWEARYRAEVEAAPPQDRAGVLARALTREGYAASVRDAPSGDQLCQHHCPVAHVAAEFPQLCEAETQAFSRLLGSHVQRLATIGHGDGVCTTHVPDGQPPAQPMSHSAHEPPSTTRSSRETRSTRKARSTRKDLP